MKVIIPCIIGISFGFFALAGVFDAIYNYNTQYDYTHKIVVDKPEKIDQAISNAINNVESHRFKVMSLNVEKLYTRPFGFGDIRYVIRCSGMTDASVLNM